MIGKCGVCYEPLGHGEKAFHAKCSQKLFGTRTPPTLSIAAADIEKLAKKTVAASVTVPGVQTKISLHLQKPPASPGRLTIVGLWGAFILKPPTDQYPHLPETEDLTMHLAEIAGIKTVPHGLMPLEDGRMAYITRRVDRVSSSRGRKKIVTQRHMEDMCQLAEKMTEHKYIGSVEQIAALVRKHSASAGYDITRLFDLVLFSFLAGNADMHLKNISLLYDKNGYVNLAPAYDLLSTRLIIPEKLDPEESALAINGKKAKLQRTDFETFGRTAGMTQKQIDNAFDRLLDKVTEMIAFLSKGSLPPQKSLRFRELILSRAERISPKPSR